jgi:Spy/CpxP family protein refolding chaperone
MKNYILAITLFAAGMATAQVEKTKSKDLSPTERADRLTANMKKQLNLTSEQEAKIRVMNLEHIQQQDEITNRIRSAQEEKRQNNEKFKNDVSSVLTPEQQAKAKEVMEERKEKAAERKAQRRK